MTPPPTALAEPIDSRRAPAEPIIDPEPSRPASRSPCSSSSRIPFLAVLAAVPVAWGWGLGWLDLAIAFAFYVVAGHGITVGLPPAASRTARSRRTAR